jgi:hypothetical protein
MLFNFVAMKCERANVIYHKQGTPLLSRKVCLKSCKCEIYTVLCGLVLCVNYILLCLLQVSIVTCHKFFSIRLMVSLVNVNVSFVVLSFCSSYCLSLDLRLLFIPLKYSSFINRTFVLFSLGHCVVCSYSIYPFDIFKLFFQVLMK